MMFITDIYIYYIHHMSCQWHSQGASALPEISVKIKNNFSVLRTVNVLPLSIAMVLPIL